MKQNHDSADRRKKFGQICFVTAKFFWFCTNNYVSMHLLLRKSKKTQQNNWHKIIGIKRYYDTEKILYHITTYGILVKCAIRYHCFCKYRVRKTISFRF